jgi:hypothetical protein
VTPKHLGPVSLPERKFAAECHIACEAQTWREIENRLKASSPNEACVFVLTEPSRGETRTTVLLRKPIWPQLGEVVATPYSLEISADYIARATDGAIDEGENTGIALIHTHPRTEFGEGVCEFSERDDRYELRLFPTLLNGRPRSLSASVVLGSRQSDLSARVWWNEANELRTQNVHLVRLVGPEVVFIETPNSYWTDHPDPDVMDRSTRLWGKFGRQILQNVRVGVVGAGGTGSIVLLALATMGAGKIRSWDGDVVKKENLHRTLGSTRAKIGSNKAVALREILEAAATAEPFIYEPNHTWATTADGLARLKDCDLVFCCVDKFTPRVALNAFAYAHLVPVIDIASWIHANENDIVDAIMTHAHVWSPGILCAWCRGTITSARLTREAQGNQRGAEYRIAYGLTGEQTEHVEPSVLPLNIAGVGLALLQFMQIGMRITSRTPTDLKLLLPEWELDECDLTTVPDCVDEMNVARGDSVAIAPTNEI